MELPTLWWRWTFVNWEHSTEQRDLVKKTVITHARWWFKELNVIVFCYHPQGGELSIHCKTCDRFAYEICSSCCHSTPRNAEKGQSLNFEKCPSLQPFPKVFKCTGLCRSFLSKKLSEISRCDQSNMMPPAMRSTICGRPTFRKLTSAITGANPWITDGKKTLSNLRSIAPKQDEVRVPEAVAYAKKISWGVSFTGICWSFVFGVRRLWRHNLTSYSCFQTNVLPKFVDIICIFF